MDTLDKLLQKLIGAQKIKLPFYRMKFSSSFFISNSKSRYERHQGEKEKARRLRQIGGKA